MLRESPLVALQRLSSDIRHSARRCGLARCRRTGTRSQRITEIADLFAGHARRTGRCIRSDARVIHILCLDEIQNSISDVLWRNAIATEVIELELILQRPDLPHAQKIDRLSATF